MGASRSRPARRKRNPGLGGRRRGEKRKRSGGGCGKRAGPWVGRPPRPRPPPLPPPRREIAPGAGGRREGTPAGAGPHAAADGDPRCDRWGAGRGRQAPFELFLGACVCVCVSPLCVCVCVSPLRHHAHRLLLALGYRRLLIWARLAGPADAAARDPSPAPRAPSPPAPGLQAWEPLERFHPALHTLSPLLQLTPPLADSQTEKYPQTGTSKLPSKCQIKVVHAAPMRQQRDGLEAPYPPAAGVGCVAAFV